MAELAVRLQLIRRRKRRIDARWRPRTTPAIVVCMQMGHSTKGAPSDEPAYVRSYGPLTAAS